jgi:hypothetical protein
VHRIVSADLVHRADLGTLDLHDGAADLALDIGERARQRDPEPGRIAQPSVADPVRRAAIVIVRSWFGGRLHRHAGQP